MADTEPLPDWERELLEKQAAEQLITDAVRHHRDSHPWLTLITDCAAPECKQAVRAHVQAVTGHGRLGAMAAPWNAQADLTGYEHVGWHCEWRPTRSATPPMRTGSVTPWLRRTTTLASSPGDHG